MSKGKILNFEPFVDPLLLDAGYEVIHITDKCDETICAAAKDCVAILTRTEKISAATLEGASELKVVARFGAGFDNVDVAKATELGVWVTNVPDGNTVCVAEGVIYLIMALGRRFTALERGLRNNNWALRNQLVGNDIAGKTLGIIGLGRIGRIVATKAMSGLDMQVKAYDPYVTQESAPKGVMMVADRDEFFRSCDFITVQLPYTGEVLVGEREFSLMKSSAYFLNLSRGLVVDEKALIRALEEKRIAGAGLDVFTDEPPRVDNPLLSMDNVVVLPHCTGITAETFERNSDSAATSILEVLAGKRPACAVNTPENPRNFSAL